MENKLALSLYMAYKKIQIEFSGLADKMGLDAAPLSALLKLWRNDGLTITELGEKMFLKASTITSLIDRMERDGLVCRERNQEDRRVVRIFLTDKAKGLKGQYPSLDESIKAKISGKMSEDEVEDLIALLNKLESLL
ncbi:transcriptional regulator, MarR family [Desulforamulus reducens MI-1]|uniref:Transcriptional regulator, MarR family n=1 Tax=Desulforamulus reducens (strain ATCC BAA-1160 / DSM 100696 / MI-1) TaxID=349161 RepID=A4J9Q2_DESRM|nr:MarR family transcriptional regulator [Desulforamulus reducens]ABO51805.1 transcriptional regulator, MarR family [Desulforamulus reducens MI-1]